MVNIWVAWFGFAMGVLGGGVIGFVIGMCRADKEWADYLDN